MAKKDQENQGAGSGTYHDPNEAIGGIFGKLFDFFKRFGSLGRLLAGLSSLFTEAQLDQAIALVKEAVDKFAGLGDNNNRRVWAAAQLVERFHLPQHLANLLVELAVTRIKHAEDEAFKKLDDVLVGRDGGSTPTTPPASSSSTPPATPPTP